MTNKIEAKETSVGELFSENFIFNIPIYQRPFSWKSDNFDQLFQDIIDTMDNKEEQYFLGSIILQETGKNKYDLIDGQQRLTAIAILMAVIRDFTNNENLKRKINGYIYQEEDVYKGLPAVMRITPWDELNDLFQKYLFTDGGTKLFLSNFLSKKIRYKDTQDPKYHIYEAIDTFNNKLSKINELEQLVKDILNRVYVVCIKASSLTSAFRLFIVLNSRGLPLNTSDLLKSENLGAIENNSKRDEYAKIWKTIEDELGREDLENIIVDIMTIKTKEKAKLSIYEEYKKIFDKKLLEKGVKFIDYLKDISNIYNDKVIDGEVNLKYPEHKNKYKILINLMFDFIPFSDWIPPLLAFHHKFGSDDFLLEFIIKLEKKVIIEWAAGFSSTERLTSLNKLIKLIEASNSEKQVVDNLLIYKGEEDSRGKKARIVNFDNKEEIEKILISKLDDYQFYNLYGGDFARYILLRIDMELWDLENFPGYPGTITIEHILPQSPPNNSEWVEIFTEEERNDWTNKLGNLVLLSGRKNSKAQNSDFEKKKLVYFNKKSTPFKITQDIEKYNVWNIKNLKERHQLLINTIKEVIINEV
ncbi:DUF262 domain-containing protein [Candidatus Woesearchaeota archaeon]|nr:DUF262 domain-containing protein [Candidatus Woesearchaeota archaeon]